VITHEGYGSRRGPEATALRRALRAALAVGVLVLLLVGAAARAADTNFPDPTQGQHVYDTASALSGGTRHNVEQILDDLKDRSGANVVMYTQVSASDRTPDATRLDGKALLDQWKVGGPDGDGAVIFWNFNKDLSDAEVAIVAGPSFLTRVGQPALDDIVNSTIASSLDSKNWNGAAISSAVNLSVEVANGAPESPAPVPSGETPAPRPSQTTAHPGGTLDPNTPAGPPYPDPIADRTVYDYAGILSPATEAKVSSTIAAIRERTAAEVVVYTQVKPESDSESAAQADADALINQWGVGRKGFDDGLAILFDVDETKCHGQVQLDAGDGYRAAFLSNDQRQAIFNDDMLPYLRGCDMNGALLAAMDKINDAATPENAQALQNARQIDAALGLVAAPLIFVALIAWIGFAWLRFGRDPIYLDDESVLLPAPPQGMTPPAAAVLMEGKDSRRALTTAMIDLASRGDIAFHEEKGLAKSRVGVQLTTANPSDARVQLNRRPATDPAEAYALEQVRSIGDDQDNSYIEAKDLLAFGKHVDRFNDLLGDYVTSKGWFREAPQASIERWRLRGGVILVLGVIVAIIAFNLPSQGLTLIGAALIAAAVIFLIVARYMPQRTMAGSMVFAMLAAYRRTLKKTLDQARSLNEVVAAKALPWLETPDQAVVWGVAFGLHDEIEQVISRSTEDLESGRALRGTYLPVWYMGGVSSGGGNGGAGGMAPGLFSGSPIPDFGGMMSALGTIGNSPASSSSGGGGGGGFGGGGSSGGGGAGGGF
jgi:uncharacterized membrane protein YgcG